MFSRKTKADATVDTFASTAHEAVDSAASFLDEAIDRLSPKVKDVADKATGLVQQVPAITEHAASQAKDRASGSAKELIIPAALAAKEQVTPLVSTAREAVAPRVASARDAAAPRVQNLVEAAQPYLETARTRVQSDLLPQLNERLQHVADEHPAVADYSNRGQAALSALRGETTKYVPVEIDDPKSSKLKTFAKVAGVGALLAAVAVALRKFLGSKDDGWTAHKPSPAYTTETKAPSSTPAATRPADTKPADDKATSVPVESYEVKTVSTTVEDKPADSKPAEDKPVDAELVNEPAKDSATTSTGNDDQAAAPLVATSVEDAEEIMSDEGGPVVVGESTDAAAVPATAAPAADSKKDDSKKADSTKDESKDEDESVDAELANAEPQYGEGWYMGDNPPSDYLIKGNERSMKYHVPGSGGYERTIADVWFSSEDAAQKAGFTRAQR